MKRPLAIGLLCALNLLFFLNTFAIECGDAAGDVARAPDSPRTYFDFESNGEKQSNVPFAIKNKTLTQMMHAFSELIHQANVVNPDHLAITVVNNAFEKAQGALTVAKVEGLVRNPNHEDERISLVEVDHTAETFGSMLEAAFKGLRRFEREGEIEDADRQALIGQLLGMFTASLKGSPLRLYLSERTAEFRFQSSDFVIVDTQNDQALFLTVSAHFPPERGDGTGVIGTIIVFEDGHVRIVERDIQ